MHACIYVPSYNALDLSVGWRVLPIPGAERFVHALEKKRERMKRKGRGGGEGWEEGTGGG